MVRLRPYQEDLVESIRDEYRQGRKRVLAVAPTGAGKTICFSYIAQQSLSRGTRTLILVHRQELLDQTSRTLAAFDVPHGLVAARVKPDFSHGIQLASVQSLIRRMEKMPAPDLIVIDEAHHAVAGSWRQVIDRYAESRLLGVTATPERLDGQGLGSVFEQIVYGQNTLHRQPRISPA
jgi:superfamily II DNA or RNA helicase